MKNYNSIFIHRIFLDGITQLTDHPPKALKNGTERLGGGVKFQAILPN